MSSNRPVNDKPPMWATSKLENEIVVDSLNAYIKTLGRVIQKVKSLGENIPNEGNSNPTRDESLENIVDVALKAHASIVNRRTVVVRKRELEISTGEDVKPEKKPRVAIISSPVQTVTPKNEYTVGEMRRQRVEIGRRQRFCLITKCQYSIYEECQDYVAEWLEEIGIPTEASHVAIPQQKFEKYSWSKKLYRIIFEVDDTRTQQILKQFKGDRCESKYDFKKEFIMKELTDWSILQLNLFMAAPRILGEKCFSPADGYTFKSGVGWVTVYKDNKDVTTITLDNMITTHKRLFQMLLQGLGENEKAEIEDYAKELEEKGKPKENEANDEIIKDIKIEEL